MTVKQDRNPKVKKAIMTVGVVIIAAALLLAATFAWFTTQEQKLNRFATQTEGTNNGAGVEIIEKFDPDEGQKFEPGVTVDKEVAVIQTGTGTAIVRVRFEEILRLYKATLSGSGDADGLVEVLFDYDDTNRPADADVGKVTDKYVRLTQTKDSFETKANKLGYQLVATPDEWAGDANVVVYGKATPVVLKDERTVAYEYIAARKSNDGNWQILDIVFQGSMKNVETIDPNSPTPITSAADFLAAATKAYEDGTPNVPTAKLQYRYLERHDYSSGQYYTQGVYVPGTQTILDNANQDAHNIIKLNFESGAFKPIADFATDGFGDVWYYDSDGWFYYGQVLASGDVSSSLLKTVGFEKVAGNNWTGMKYDVNVRMEALQVVPEAVQDEWNSNTAGDTYGASWNPVGGLSTQDLTDLGVTFEKTNLTSGAKDFLRAITEDENTGSGWTIQ